MKRTFFALGCCLFLVMLHLASGTANAQDPSAQALLSQHALSAADLKVHEPFIRQCYTLALSAASKGDHPFGAVLVHNGKVVATSENTVNAENDFSRHAEINLMVHARRTLPKEVIRNSTVYVSTAPCPSCTSVMAEQGIVKIVYGVHYVQFNKRLGIKGKILPCDVLYEMLGRKVEFIGPVLEAEGLQVFDHWPESDANARWVRQAKTQGN